MKDTLQLATQLTRYIQQQQSERRDIKMGPKELNNHAVNQFNKGRLNTALEAFIKRLESCLAIRVLHLIYYSAYLIQPSNLQLI
ncbi:hypothetical protein P4S63_03630 [Pseudoalteromonas sp. B193]